jgi:tripartite-type tricarboxylate transporter receptor subunit TctC
MDMNLRKSLLAVLTSIVFVLVFANILFAIEYPMKPVTVVVGFAPGGASDLSVRALSDKFAKGLGAPVSILNKPGSGSLVAGEYVAKAKADGYTLFVFLTPLLIRQVIDPKMTLDVFKEFDPVCNYVSVSMFIGVKRDSEFKTLDDLINFASKNPDKLSCGSAGVGTVAHYCLEYLKIKMNIKFKHVPFTGEGPSVTALMGGHIDFVVASSGVILSKVASGDLRLLASFDETRNADTKDVVTIKEKGFPEAVFCSYYSLVVPAGTPKEAKEKINEAMRSIIQDPEVAERLRKAELNTLYLGPTDLAKFNRLEFEKYKKLSNEAGITLK